MAFYKIIIGFLKISLLNDFIAKIIFSNSYISILGV